MLGIHVGNIYSSPNSFASCSTKNLCLVFSTLGSLTLTLQYRSPLLRLSSSNPKSLTLRTSPGWVPSGIFTFIVFPSRYGISNSLPSIAFVTGIEISHFRSSPSLL